MKIQILIISLLMIGLVSSLTINSPTNNGWVQDKISLLNVTSELTNSNLSFYVANDTNFDRGNLICYYTNTGLDSYGCNFTATTKTIPTSNLLTHWKFDRENPMLDSQGYKNIDSVLGGASNIQNGGVLKDAYYFDGINDQLYLDSTPSYFANTGKQTVSFWFNRFDNRVSYLIAYWQTSSKNRFYVSTSGDNIGATIGSTGFGCGQAGINYEYNEWNNLVVIRDATTNRGLCYLNGELITNTSVSFGTKTATQTMYISGGPNTGYPVFKGYMDDFYIWNRQLTSDEIANLYEYGEGTYYFKVNDTNGTIENLAQTFTRDLYNPVLSLYSPHIDEAKNFNINLTSTDNYNFTINVSLDGSNIYSNGFNETQNYFSNQTLGYGTHNLTIILTDQSGRTTIKEKLFDIIKIQTINFYNSKDIIIKPFGIKDFIIRFFGGQE